MEYWRTHTAHTTIPYAACERRPNWWVMCAFALCRCCWCAFFTQPQNVQQCRGVNKYRRARANAAPNTEASALEIIIITILYKFIFILLSAARCWRCRAVLTHDKNEAKNKKRTQKKCIYYRLVKQIIFVSFAGWVNIDTMEANVCDESKYMHAHRACDIESRIGRRAGEWIKSAYGFESVVADAVAHTFHYYLCSARSGFNCVYF